MKLQYYFRSCYPFRSLVCIYISYSPVVGLTILISGVDLMRKEVLGKCPVCSKDLEVVKLNCRSCGTSIEGHFDLCKFCLLTKEQKEFAAIFIKNRGNIKEMEKEMGISYPTVKNKLENLIEALGYKIQPEEINNKKEVLEKLYNGEISADDAIKMMNE